MSHDGWSSEFQSYPQLHSEFEVCLGWGGAWLRGLREGSKERRKKISIVFQMKHLRIQACSTLTLLFFMSKAWHFLFRKHAMGWRDSSAVKGWGSQPELQEIALCNKEKEHVVAFVHKIGITERVWTGLENSGPLSSSRLLPQHTQQGELEKAKPSQTDSDCQFWTHLRFTSVTIKGPSLTFL